MKCIDRKEIWNDGYVELWEIEALESKEEICAFISQVNYGNKIKDIDKHYRRLLTENGGSPSEILEFAPYSAYAYTSAFTESEQERHFSKFGTYNGKYFLTNLRNVVGFEKLFDETLIMSNFVIVKLKIPQMIVPHFLRHSMFAHNWKSHRPRTEREYFESDEVKVINHAVKDNLTGKINIADYPVLLKGNRQELVNKGAFGLSYTEGFMAGWLDDSYTWDNLVKVRDSKNTQKETKQIVRVIKRLIEKNYDHTFYKY